MTASPRIEGSSIKSFGQGFSHPAPFWQVFGSFASIGATGTSIHAVPCCRSSLARNMRPRPLRPPGTSDADIHTMPQPSWVNSIGCDGTSHHLRNQGTPQGLSCSAILIPVSPAHFPCFIVRSARRFPSRLAPSGVSILTGVLLLRTLLALSSLAFLDIQPGRREHRHLY